MVLVGRSDLENPRNPILLHAGNWGHGRLFALRILMALDGGFVGDKYRIFVVIFRPGDAGARKSRIRTRHPGNSLSIGGGRGRIPDLRVVRGDTYRVYIDRLVPVDRTTPRSRRQTEPTA